MRSQLSQPQSGVVEHLKNEYLLVDCPSPTLFIVQRDWIGDRATVLTQRLSERGLTVEPSEAREIISQRVLELSETMGISAVTARGYVTDEAISDLADMLAGLLADEAPGADLMAEPRSVLLPQKLVGRAVAGLSEAILFYQQHGDENASTRDQIRELAEHLSIFGSLIAEATMPAAQIPRAMVTRIAARLDRAAGHPDVPEELRVAWRRDAMRMRLSLSLCARRAKTVVNPSVLRAIRYSAVFVIRLDIAVGHGVSAARTTAN